MFSLARDYEQLNLMERVSALGVLSALPKCKVTSSIEAVRDFFKEKKPAAYFN